MLLGSLRISALRREDLRSISELACDGLAVFYMIDSDANQDCSSEQLYKMTWLIAFRSTLANFDTTILEGNWQARD
jgi:hypothetical protein